MFMDRNIKKQFKFTIYNYNESLNILVQDSYSYLGILFNCNGSSVKYVQLAEHAQKCLYSLYRKIRNMSLPIYIQLKLFDISPILLYCVEE